MERPLRRLIGLAALLGPGLHLLSDVMEWVGGGFSPTQLWVNYLAFLLIPFLMVGLYAVQRPHAGRAVLWGGLLYGSAFVYFAFTALYAVRHRVANYSALWQELGVTYTAHGGLMVVGGILFAVGTWRAAVLPRPAVLAFVVGVSLNLLFGLLPVPDIWQTVGSTLRNLGLMGMGTTLLIGRPGLDAA